MKFDRKCIPGVISTYTDGSKEQAMSEQIFMNYRNVKENARFYWLEPVTSKGALCCTAAGTVSFLWLRISKKYC